MSSLVKHVMAIFLALAFFFTSICHECSTWKIRPNADIYSNGLPLIFFLVFQGFDWRSGSVDPNPWSWMSGSIREGIGKDGCSERDQFSRNQMS